MNKLTISKKEKLYFKFSYLFDKINLIFLNYKCEIYKIYCHNNFQSQFIVLNIFHEHSNNSNNK